ncbi:MAG: cyclophilin-like fold protein [Candidatus Aenigmatarchaeota archaeon]
MQKKIKIITKKQEMIAELTEKNPRTAEAIYNSLPIEGNLKKWGEEVFFDCGINLEEENSQKIVSVGDVAYWPPGRAICIFFGKTPFSRDEKPIAFSPVNVFGKIKSNFRFLKNIKDGEKIRIEKH